MKQSILITGLTIVLFATMVLSSSLTVSAEPFKDEGKGLRTKYETEHYNYDFSTMLDEQMNKSTLPQTDSDGDWYDASEALTQYYMNPENLQENSSDYYQFLKLSSSSEVSVKQLNDEILHGKGELEGKAKEFKQASEKEDVNEIYLIAHALHETGEGKSELAEGVKVGKNKKGNPVLETSSNHRKLKDVETVYNFFGIKADDDNALKNGAKHAYEEEWTTPEDAIVGGAAYIAKDYISKGQDTLYKMRWDPDNHGGHQYATDVGWAVKQTDDIKRVYDMLQDVDGVVMTFEVPEFNNQPAAEAKPDGADMFHVNKDGDHVGERGEVKEKDLRLREGPTTDFPTITKLAKDKKVTVIGENADWYKVKTAKEEGWVSADDIKVKDKGKKKD